MIELYSWCTPVSWQMVIHIVNIKTDVYKRPRMVAWTRWMYAVVNNNDSAKCMSRQKFYDKSVSKYHPHIIKKDKWLMLHLIVVRRRSASHRSSSDLSSIQQGAWSFHNVALTTGWWSAHHRAKISEKTVWIFKKGDCQHMCLNSLLPSHRFGVYKKNELHPRYLFHLQNIRFKLQIQSLIQSFILKNATLIFLNPSTTAGILQV